MKGFGPEPFLLLSPNVLQAFAATFGGVRGCANTATPTELARGIFDGRAAPRLARELEAVGRFLTDAGRRALVEAATARGLATTVQRSGWQECPAGDVAASLAIERETKTGRERTIVRRLFAFAGLRLDRELAERPTYELLAERPIDRAHAEKAIRRTLGARVKAVWTRERAGEAAGEGEGEETVFAVFVSSPAETRLAFEWGAFVPGTSSPVRVDLVAIDAAGQRVSMTLAQPERLRDYAEALGLSFRPSFTLRTLTAVKAGELARVAQAAGARRVTLVALRVRLPDGSRSEVRAFDVLDPAVHGALPRAGYVDRATVRIELEEGGSMDAFLELPHRIDLPASSSSGARVARQVLRALGVFDPGALPDDARSLAPYEHGEWRWRAVVGEEGFASLVKRGLLVRGLSRHVATEEHRMHGAGYVVRRVAGRKKGRGEGEEGEEEEYALAEDRSLGARMVTAKERVAWRLDTEALAASMRRDLGATPAPKPRAIELEGVVDLGIVTLPKGQLRFVYAMGTPPKGWAGVVSRACAIGVTPVVLAPREREDEAGGLLRVELEVAEQFGVRPVGAALGEAAEALGAAEDVERWRRHDQDVLIDSSSSRVWIRGTEVALNDKPYRFLEYLARAAGQVVPTKELGEYVSRSEYPDAAARRLKGELEKQVVATLEAAGVDTGVVTRLIVVDGKKGYRLGVTARIL